MSWATSRLRSFLFIAVLVLSAGNAMADDVDDARELGKQGLEHYRAGRWEKCIETMKAAEASFHAPTHLLYMARCEASQGKLLVARDLYAKVAAEELAPDANPRWHEAVAEAKVEGNTLAARIPAIIIVVADAPDGADARLDGRSVALEVPTLVDPGTHEVEVRAPGHAKAKQSVQAAEGAGVIRVAFKLVTKSKPPSPVPSPALAPPPAEPVAAERILWPGILMVGVGGSALLVATGLGVIAISTYNNIRERCDEALHCDPEDEERAASGTKLADASTGLFVVGGLLAAGGIVLLIVPPTREQSVGLRLAPGAVSLAGSF